MYFSNLILQCILLCYIFNVKYNKIILGDIMAFNLKNLDNKVNASYKTIYLKQEIIEKVDKLANENNTSFNNIIVKMIESCLEDLEKSNEENKKS